MPISLVIRSLPVAAMTRALLRYVLPCLLVTGLAGTAIAQAPAPDAGPQIIRLEPKPMEGLDRGKAVVVKGKAGPEAHRFLVDGLSFMNPVGVALRPVDKGNRVELAITKYAWNSPLRQGDTDGDILRYGFRTEGEFQISVTAPEPGTDYRLMVWVGDETKPDFAPVVVKASEFEGEGGGWGSLVLWVIAGALVLLVGLVAFIAFRRKSS